MGQLVSFCAGTSINVLPSRHVDALLLNVPNNAESERKMEASINLIKMAQPQVTLLDSGGYQLYRAQEDGLQIVYDEKAKIYLPGAINLTPSHLIRGAVGIRPQIIVGLDFPIKKIQEKEKQEVEFRFKLGFNVDWAIRTAELRQKYCPDIKLFIPIQCYTLQHLDLFVRLIGNIPFDGFSMPVRNLSLAEIALFLMKFYSMGIRQVHLLGTLQFFTIALSAYAAVHLFDWVSLDATTWRIGAEKQKYLNPHDLSIEIMEKDVRIDERIRIDCPCPWCEGRTYTYIKNLPYTEKTAFLRSHNYWVTMKVCRELYQNAKTLSSLKGYLMKVSSRPEKVRELIRILEILEICKDLDISAAQELLLAR